MVERQRGDIYMLDYLQMLHLRAGYFQSEEEAWAWVKQNDPEQKHYYTPVRIGAARPDTTTGIQYRYRYASQS